MACNGREGQRHALTRRRADARALLRRAGGERGLWRERASSPCTNSNALRQQIRELQQQNQQVQLRIRELQSDPRAIEERAREELRMGRPGETVIALPAQRAVPVTQPPSPPARTVSPNRLSDCAVLTSIHLLCNLRRQSLDCESDLTLAAKRR